MTWALLLLTTLGEPPKPDLYLVIGKDAEKVVIGLRLETNNGPLAKKQTNLLQGKPFGTDGLDPFASLVQDGRLLRCQLAAPSPHVQPLTQALFEALDGDKDGQISRAEAKSARERLLAQFDADQDEALTALEIVPDLLTHESAKMATPASAEIVFPDAQTGRIVTDQVHALQLDMPGEIIASANGLTITIVAAAANPVQIPETPKSLWRPGREKEKTRFEALASEVVSLTMRPQPLGYFERLDANGDGQLSPRELKAAEKVLFGASSEKQAITLPDFASGKSFSVSLSPGASTRPPVRLARSAQAAVGPVWFRALDRNGDGDLTPREFIGSRAKFQLYDADGDGWISASEAEAGDRKLSK